MSPILAGEENNLTISEAETIRINADFVSM